MKNITNQMTIKIYLPKFTILLNKIYSETEMTIKMNEKTAQAYREVLKHWRLMPDEEIMICSLGCAFCQRFDDGCKLNNEICPINILTTYSGCRDTPFDGIANHLDSVTDSDHLFGMYDDECSDCHDLWEAEVDFLESLNPEIANEKTDYTWAFMSDYHKGLQNEKI